MTQRSKTTAASTAGSFAPHEHSESEVALDARRAERETRVEYGLRLLGEASNLRGEERTAKLAEADAAFARHDRKAKPLHNLSMQPSARSVAHFLWSREQLELNPPYQRGSVWSTPRRRELIRSLLRGIPIGTITVNSRVDGSATTTTPPYAVVDGKQRVEALRALADGEFAVPADWFEDREVVMADEAGMVFFRDLSEIGRRRFTNLAVSTIEARVKSVEAEAQLFELLNFGGVPQGETDAAQ